MLQMADYALGGFFILDYGAGCYVVHDTALVLDLDTFHKFHNMKVLAWNVQGIKNRQTRQEVRCLIRSHKPEMIFLTETMVVEATTQRLTWI